MLSVSEALSLALACITCRICAVVSGDQQVAAPFFSPFLWISSFRTEPPRSSAETCVGVDSNRDER